MLRAMFAGAGVLVLVSTMAVQAEPPSPAKDSAGQPVRLLTIRGKAINQEGKPVAKAKVHIVAYNTAYNREAVAETTTNNAGEYVFQDAPLPLPTNSLVSARDAKSSEGSFQVFALADGYGLTWTPKLRFTTGPRPQDKIEKDLIYVGEEGRADLAFDLPASLSGRVTNEQGQPLAGVRVQVGHCDDLRRPGMSGIFACSYLGPQGDEAQAERNSLVGIRHVPEKYRLAVTDEQGRYQFTQLRRDSEYLVLLNAGPECDPVMFNGLTSTKELRGCRTLGYEGKVNQTFKTPWQIAVKVVSPDGRPQANVKIRARRDRTIRSGGLATTNAAGEATLRLLADKHTLFLEPPYGSPYVLTEQEVTVSPESAGAVQSLTLNPGATLLIKAVEEGTGKPIAGVSFMEDIDSGKRRQELYSQTVFVDHPVTDEHGELRAVVKPGERRLLVAKQPSGFEPMNKSSELLKLAAKGSETVTFTFKKAAATTSVMTFVPEDEGELGKLNALILRQQELTKAGRFEVNSHRASMGGHSVDELRSLLAISTPQEIPKLLVLLRTKYPALVAVPSGEMTVIVDGFRFRNDCEIAQPLFETKLRSSMAFNGMESLIYTSNSPQVDIFSGANARNRIAVIDSKSLTGWQPVHKIRQEPGEVLPVHKVKHDGGRVTVESTLKWGTDHQVFDEKTGFLYHQIFLQNDGKTGTERWQFGPRLEPSGAIIPELVVELAYRGNQEKSLRVYEIVSANLGPQPPDSFAVSVPAGTLILDHSGNQRTPKTAMVQGPITDVVAEANRIADNARSILNVLNDGDPAPAIEPAAWLNADGPTEKLDWKGKVLLVDFWGTGCGPCIAELSRVQEFALKFQKAGGVVLGLHDSSCEPAAVTEFVRKRGLTYPFAIDKPAVDGPSFGTTFESFGIRGIPNCAVIDQKGTVVFLGRFEESAERAIKLLEMETK